VGEEIGEDYKGGEIVKGYKYVSRLPSGKLVSLVTEGKAQVEYIPGKWTKAPEWLAREGYHLTFYPEQPYPVDDPERGIELWECKVRKIIKEEDLPACCRLSPLKKGKLERDFIFLGFWPAGTWMAKEIKLIRQIRIRKFSIEEDREINNG